MSRPCGAVDDVQREDERTPLLASGTTTTSRSTSSKAQHELPVGTGVTGIGDEEANVACLPAGDEASSGVPEYPSKAVVVRLVSILLIGVFISNADGSILLATHSVISSEFDALSDSSWLMTSYSLAMAATQTLYGKLSDIYGRRVLFLVAYTLFGLGCAVVGIGRNFHEVVLGRVISGIGGAGMTTLVSIIITDLVPIREVASWRSYVNIVATVGRSLGGPVGGYLADTIGWRWSFIGQAPLIGIAMTLCWVFFPPSTPTDPKHTQIKEEEDDSVANSNFSRIDFLGALLMAAAILLFLFPIELGGVKLAWTDRRIFLLLAFSAVTGVLFLLTEAYWAKEPIFPLQLLRQKDAVLSFLIQGLQTAAQLGMMFSVPLYFQVTSQATFTVAGAHLMPAVIGNTIGGLLAGYLIHRTGRYKILVIAAASCSALCYALLILRWNGHTGFLESLYIFPGGFGTGIAQSALFISLQAAITHSQSAVAASALYLSSTVGMVVGMAGSSAVQLEVLRRGLARRLDGSGLGGQEKKSIIDRAVSDVSYVGKVDGWLKDAVVSAYVEGLDAAHGTSLACSLMALLGGIFLTERKI